MGYRLISIGVNVAPNASPLRFAENDAARVRHMLTGSRGPATDDEADLLVGRAATMQALVNRLQILSFFPPEHLVLYFSGHGNERGIALADGFMPYSALAALLEAIPAQTKVVVLDTCHAGGAARLFGEHIASVGAEGLDDAWIELLEAAPVGLRVFAAVGLSQTAKEDPAIQGSRFTHAWLGALRYAPGDLVSGGYHFVSDLQAFRYTERLIAKRWPSDPRPQLLTNCDVGRLPLVQSQREAAVGLAQIVGVALVPGQVAARVRIHAYERRHVVTRATWTVTTMTGAVLGRGDINLVPQRRAHTMELVLPVAAASLLRDQLLGYWLRQGLGVKLTWNVRLRDDVGHPLDAKAYSAVYSLAGAAH
jgi:hypothetical protein